MKPRDANWRRIHCFVASFEALSRSPFVPGCDHYKRVIINSQAKALWNECESVTDGFHTFRTRTRSNSGDR
jgi:hypothetical protein